MIEGLKIPCLIEIRDFDNNMICQTGTDRKGIIPYLNYNVVSWFVRSNTGCAFCVMIDDREE